MRWKNWKKKRKKKKKNKKKKKKKEKKKKKKKKEKKRKEKKGLTFFASYSPSAASQWWWQRTREAGTGHAHLRWSRLWRDWPQLRMPKRPSCNQELLWRPPDAGPASGKESRERDAKFRITVYAGDCQVSHWSGWSWFIWRYAEFCWYCCGSGRSPLYHHDTEWGKI